MEELQYQEIMAALSGLSQMVGNIDRVTRDTLTRVEALEEGQKALEEGQKALEEGQKALEEGQKALKEDMEQVQQQLKQQNQTLLRGFNERIEREQAMSSRLDRLEVRVTELEVAAAGGVR